VTEIFPDEVLATEISHGDVLVVEISLDVLVMETSHGSVSVIYYPIAEAKATVPNVEVLAET
jgi:hypothetical protein